MVISQNQHPMLQCTTVYLWHSLNQQSQQAEMVPGTHFQEQGSGRNNLAVTLSLKPLPLNLSPFDGSGPIQAQLWPTVGIPTDQ